MGPRDIVDILRCDKNIAVMCLNYLVLLFLLILGVCDGGPMNCAKNAKNPIGQKWMCKEVDELKKLLEQQTAAMQTQATTLGARLDTSDAKLKELQDQGTKLTELMTEQQTKLTEQGETLLAEEDELSEKITEQGKTLTEKMTTQETKLAEIEGKEAQLAEEITAQDKKITTIKEEGEKLIETLTTQEKT